MIIKHYPHDASYHDVFEAVRQFILEMNEIGKSVIYHWSRWEWYMARESFSMSDLDQIRIYYDNDQIIGILMLEDESNIFYYVTTSQAVKAHILKHLQTIPEARLMVEDQDHDMHELLKENHWKDTDYEEHMARLTVDHIPIHISNDYELLCLDDDYDVKQHHMCLWRGFNHEGEPRMDKETLISRARQVSSPNFKRKYAYAATYQGAYVAYTSMWYQKGTNIAMVEPVCTVPEHRKKGLATATISKCVDAVKKDGAKEIIVGTNRKFYIDMGFDVYAYARVFKQPES